MTSRNAARQSGPPPTESSTKRRRRPLLLVALPVVLSLVVTIFGASPAGALVSNTAATMAMANGNVVAIAQAQGRIFIGGTFTAAGNSPATYVPRQNLAAINAATGQFDPSFNVAVDGEILAMAVAPGGTDLILAGAFRTVGGQRRLKLARISAVTGGVLPWNPAANASVRALAISGNRLYAGGGFTTIAGQSRPYLAALDLTTGALDPAWQPAPDRAPRALEISPDGGTLYVGGAFTLIGGQSRLNLASVDAYGTGAARNWIANPDYRIWNMDIAPGGGTLYTGSDTNRVTAWPTTGPVSTPRWTVRGNGNVQGIAASGTAVYAGGHFYTMGGIARERLAAFDPITGTLLPWTPSANSYYGVGPLAIAPDGLLVGGDFTQINGIVQERFARFPGPP